MLDRTEVEPTRYRDYVRLLDRVLENLRRYYEAEEKDKKTREEESVALYAYKFLETIKSLRLKYLFSPMYLARPGVDLTTSGFPHFYDITLLDSDLSTREERLPKMGEMQELKNLLLEHLMVVPQRGSEAKHTEIELGYLWQISERAYLEGLDIRKQFFQFTPGKLVPVPLEEFAEEGRRSYAFSWGCYDSESNRPSVYFMLLSQDERERPLHDANNPELVKFLETVQHIAARAPVNLSVIAIRLDESFKTLYPKALKRLSIGPLFAPMLSKGIGNGTMSDSFAHRLMPIFERAELPDNDFVLFFSTEFVYSEREEIPHQLLSFGKQKVRQIFHVPKNDRKLMRHGATAIRQYALMPHRLRQHLSQEDLSGIPELSDREYLVYGTEQEGEILNVG